MLRKLTLVAGSLLALTAAASSAVAQEAGPLVVVDVTMKKEVVVVDAQGKRQVKLEETAAASPGDTLVYRIDYTNQGKAPALQARVVDPVPAGTVLVPGGWTAQGAEFQVSIDGGKTFESYPVRRPVIRDGSTVMEEVAPNAYTHLRWLDKQPLAPGATRSASFKVKVL